VLWINANLSLQTCPYLRKNIHGTNEKNVCSTAVRHLFYSLMEDTFMHYFIKLSDDRHEYKVSLLIENPLWLAIMVTGALRVWKYPILSPEGLDQ
jgi:hypothetical protein